ncbi:hypothetical protein K7432_013376 [Basidiobolus ranarum]|uniref:PUM-HD domain-containing protein n=1 Tax=Basidiobolus ranarum TaxID=34480 RepID=A0ABR2VRJ7_9FUNG
MSKERAAHDSNNGRDQSTFDVDISKRKLGTLNRSTSEQVLHHPTDYMPENLSDARVKPSNSRERLLSRREEVPPNSNNRSLDFIRDGPFPPSEGAFQRGSYDHRGTTFDNPIEETSHQSYFGIARLQTEPIQLLPPKAVFLENRHRANTMPSTLKNEGLFQEPGFSEEYTGLPNRHGIEAQHAEVAQDKRHSLYKRFPSDDSNIWERFNKLQMEDIGSQRLKERSSYLDESNILYNSKSSKDLHFKQDYLNGHTGLASVFDSNFNPQGGPYSHRNPRIQKETDRFPTTLSTTSPGLDISSFTAVSHQMAAAEDINPNSWAPFVTTARVEGRPIRGKMNSYDNLGSIPSSARNQNFFTPDLFDVIGDGYPVTMEHDPRHQYFKQSGGIRKPPAYSHEVEANHLVPKLVPSGNYHENHYKPNGSGDFGSGNPANSHQNGYHHPKTNTAKNSKPSSNKGNHKKPVNDVELMNRFQGVSLESLVGEIHGLCRDQYGCRYLQKKLEEQNPVYTDFIFEEVNGYFVDLMTDPFGNYLCQKLLEYSRDEQRTVLVGKVAPELVNISLNMHGTRAAQKLIEYLSNAQQIQLVIVALTPSVVPLIKDLNGNHVIQKCLNSMSAENNQFIYDAVCHHCIEVASHRHGCCVFQRCIDYASPAQKAQLISEITVNGLKLVQDPFGNYVVQYVLDLGEDHFSNSLIRTFWGSVCVLSIQKFSSNVIEKCIRVADHETRKGLIEELLNPEQLEKMLRDSFANYVVQTALDYADPVQRSLLVECIKPMIPFIKNTPYGKRIQGKLLREQAHPNAFPTQPTAPIANVGYKAMRPEYKHASMNAMGVNNHRFPFY